MEIIGPYLLFLGDAQNAKTAQGVRDWRPERCAGQLRFPGCTVDLYLPDMSLGEAATIGVRTLVVGAAPPGGRLPEDWKKTLLEALEHGLDLANGLHTRLNDDPDLTSAAKKHQRRILDVRHPTQTFQIDGFAPRSGKRLLTVGTDCSVGKMYTTLAVEREMRRRGHQVDFRATGQTGILIAGCGVSVDAVVSDFVAAAAAELSPPAPAEHWDLIEGQGSLFHPAYAGVTLGLVHGSQPDVMVLCSDPTRAWLMFFDRYPVPSLRECIEAYTRAAQLTNPRAKVAAISLNTSRMSANEAEEAMRAAARETGLPCVDPIRTGVGAIVDVLEG